MVLQFMNMQMDSLAIPYEFGERTSAVSYPYSVGECTEVPVMVEDGSEEYSFILTIFHRGQNGVYMALEEIKEKLKKHFHPVHGLRAAFEGCTIAAFYGGAFYIPTGEADLKKLQVNLTIKIWKGEY